MERTSGFDCRFGADYPDVAQCRDLTVIFMGNSQMGFAA
jgi:hypothetical protein